MSIRDFFTSKRPAPTDEEVPAKRMKAAVVVDSHIHRASAETSASGSPLSTNKVDVIEEMDTSRAGDVLVTAEQMEHILKQTHTAAPAPGTGPASIWDAGKKSKDSSPDMSSPLFSPEAKEDGKSAAELLGVHRGKPAPYALLSKALQLIEDTKHSGSGSKKRMIVILANCFRIVLHFCTDDELLSAVYLLINRVAPDFENIEVGVGDQILMRTMAEVYGRSEQHLKAAMANGEAEDLGEAALQSRVNQKMLFTPPPLTISKLFKDIRSVADTKGKDSQKHKKDIIKKCLVAAKGDEAKYIVRTLQGRLRVGIQNATVLQSLAYAICLTSPGGNCADHRLKETGYISVSSALEAQMVAMEASLKQAFCEVPDYGAILKVLIRNPNPEYLLTKCQVRPGVPIKPMLAKPTKSVTEVLDRFTNMEFTAEYKYDGERAQVHVLNRGETIEIYSRNSEHMTEKYPDIVNILKEVIALSQQTPDHPINNCILDCECVSYDREENKILPFQTLSTRARKNVKEEDIKVAVCLFPFDLIYLNDKSFVRENLRLRRETLHQYFKEIPGKLKFATFKNLATPEEVESFLTESVDGSCEGLMLKTLDQNASYEPSKRSLNWLKLKKDYIQGMGDSVDLVPIGAWYGKGKRTGAYGAFLLACYDADSGEFQSTCKIGTGFSDEDLSNHYEFYKQHIIPNKRVDYDVTEKMHPEIWFDAVQVWEVAAADLSISPVHTAGRNNAEDGKGIGLRFPRFLRIRDDKGTEDATSAEQIQQMYSSQFANKQNKNADDLDDMDDE